jgi:hypothetical protein
VGSLSHFHTSPTQTASNNPRVVPIG